MGNDSSKSSLNFCLVGSYETGKATLLKSLASRLDKNAKIETFIPTIGFNVEYITLPGMHVDSWSIGGRCPMRPLHRYYFRNADCLVYLIKSDNVYWDLEQDKYEIEKMMENEEMANKPLVILVNDFGTGHVDMMHIHDVLDVSSLFKKGPVFFTKCNALTGHGVLEFLNWLSSNKGSKVAAQSQILSDIDLVENNKVQTFHGFTKDFANFFKKAKSLLYY